MSLNEEIKNILTNTERFLKQQQELYGDTIFVSKSEPLSVVLSQMTASANTGPAAPEIDLFGTAVQATPSHHKTGGPIVPAFPSESWTKTTNLDELNGAINTC